MQTTTHVRAAAEVFNVAHPPKLDGWDAYEVWRTRVLLPRQQRGTVPVAAPLPRPRVVPQRASLPRAVKPTARKAEGNLAVYAVALSAAVALLVSTFGSGR